MSPLLFWNKILFLPLNTQKLNRKTKMENREMNNQLQIELKEDVAQGTYANLAVITHSSSEFIVDLYV